MPSISRTLRWSVPALTLALAAAGGAVGGTASTGGGKNAASCAIEASRGAGTIALTALARAEGAALSGEYTLRVTGGASGGTSDIRQGGTFRAAPGQPATLGSVQLDAEGAYDAALDITVNGETVSCTKRIGGGV